MARPLTDRERIFIAVLAIFIAVIAIYTRTLNYQFVYDDILVVGQNQFITSWDNIGQIFSGNYYYLAEENTYRPVTTLTYFFDYSIWGAEPFGFNFTGMLIHFFNSVLVLLLVRRLTGALGPSLVGALLFAVHPLAPEVVLSEGNREEALSVTFYLGAIFCYLRSLPYDRQTATWLAASVLIFLVGLFAMEMIITLPVILLLLVWTQSKTAELKIRQVVRSIIPFIIVAILFMVGRFMLWIGTGDFSTFPAGSRWLTLLTMTEAFVRYVFLVVIPVGLRPIYNFPLATGLLDSQVLLSLAIILSLLGLGLWLTVKKRISGVALLWFFVVLLPVSNLIVPFWVLFSERYLYLVLPGYSLLTAALLSGLLTRASGFWRMPLVVLVVFIIIFYSLGTVGRSNAWASSLTLWTDNVAKEPKASQALYNLGVSYVLVQDQSQAVPYFEKAVKYDKQSIDASIQLAKIYAGQGLTDRALKLLEQTLEYNPNSPDLLLEMVGILVSVGKYDQAQDALARVLAVDPEQVKALSLQASILLLKGDYSEALKLAQGAVELDPAEAQAWQVLAYLSVRAGDAKRAVKFYAKVYEYAQDQRLAASALENIRVLNGRGRDE